MKIGRINVHIEATYCSKFHFDTWKINHFTAGWTFHIVITITPKRGSAEVSKFIGYISTQSTCMVLSFRTLSPKLRIWRHFENSHFVITIMLKRRWSEVRNFVGQLSTWYRCTVSSFRTLGLKLPKWRHFKSRFSDLHISVTNDVGNTQVTFGCSLWFVLDPSENPTSIKPLVSERRLAENCQKC